MMTPCLDCGEKISDTAQACPKCGAVVPRASVWPRVIGWVLGVPAVILVLLYVLGSTIPDYQIQAGKVREACEKLAAFDQRYICDQQYEDAIKHGEAEAARKLQEK